MSDVEGVMRAIMANPWPTPEVVRNQPRFRQATGERWGEPETLLTVWNLDGLHWTEAPVPRWWHRHWPQTVGQDGPLREIWRCACGAYGGPSQRWTRT